ncbi:thiazole synthase [Salisediminibacterium halotolerans]|uniref:thiazole synthase n=1 Tax=Salisediminibacterium halotolerans TaxID=517425 RepID=UPI000EAFC040|nr:thiazole synthase [Salisediminibacterium halotolerans]RLJ73168.1 thiazole-phosphate synthase [Actinophytocola xinjiangensis]RPE86590.1 thiazole-phosphate synthase [Salisediminibacterium halotolerans]TWG33965.1 thiazole-phosphate synthase [Salisediminibacterium halotolerans]GEL06627.1 thiazole synthase [Salisediminibacterium halotolerans]
MNDPLTIAGVDLSSRLFTGTGKFGDHKVMKEAIQSSGSEVVTVAVRRVDVEAGDENVIADIPADVQLMPNTSGARTADEAVRIARLAKASGLGDWIKIEVISDQKYLLPDNEETVKATEILVNEGFTVLPYMSPDLMAAKRMEEAGAAAVMPLGAPIGSNKGIRMKDMVQIIIDEIAVPVVVDAGIGKPSEAAEAMEMGADAVLVNTAIATAEDPVQMAEAFARAVKAGRQAYRAGLGPTAVTAEASSPLTGFLFE